MPQTRTTSQWLDEIQGEIQDDWFESSLENFQDDGDADEDYSNTQINSACKEPKINGTTVDQVGYQCFGEPPGEETRDCPICYEEMQETVAVWTCGHRFCKTCFTRYCSVSLVNAATNLIQADICLIKKQAEKNMISVFPSKEYGLACPFAKCSKMIPLPQMMSSDALPKDQKERLDHFAFRSEYTKLDDVEKPCPRCAEPAYAAKEGGLSCQRCGVVSCCFCGLPSHPGVSCANVLAIVKSLRVNGTKAIKIINNLRKRLADIALLDAAFDKWASTNTLVKTCPHCGVIIEKNGGCPSMFCQHCKRGFNWLSSKTFTPETPKQSKHQERQIAKLRKRLPLLTLLNSEGL